MLKNEEIEAALRLCASDEGCEGCPYKEKTWPTSRCMNRMLNDAAECISLYSARKEAQS